MAFRLQPEAPVPLNPRYTFEHFVVGPSNGVAFSVSQAIAIGGSDCRSPLVICGRTGLGKTHLAQAVVHEVRARHPELDVVYLTAEVLIGEIVDAFRGDGVLGFRRRLARADVLVVDDAHQLAGQSEEELVHVIDAVHAERHQVVVTTIARPRDLRGVRPDLRERLEQGSIVLVERPELETRVRIALQKAAALQARLPIDVARLAAEECPASVRELEGAVVRLCAAAELHGCELTLELAREVLAPPPEDEPRAAPRAPLARPRRGRSRAALNPPGDLAAGVAELREFIRDVGGDRIGEPAVSGNLVDVPLVARDGERYVLRIAVGTYLAEPPSCTFVDEDGAWGAGAWPIPDEGGPFRSPEFICSPPTAEFYDYHRNRVYHYGEGSLTNAVAAVFQALQAPAYRGRWQPRPARRRRRLWRGL